MFVASALLFEVVFTKINSRISKNKSIQKFSEITSAIIYILNLVAISIKIF
jgi:hypothetical protein